MTPAELKELAEFTKGLAAARTKLVEETQQPAFDFVPVQSRKLYELCDALISLLRENEWLRGTAQTHYFAATCPHCGGSLPEPEAH